MSEKKLLRVVAALIQRGDAYLITQRRASAVLPLLWEFPGGRVESGERDAEALQREVVHRIGVNVDVGQLVGFVNHPYEHYAVDLFLYACTLHQGDLSPKNVTDLRWVKSADFDNYPFTPADEASMTQLLGLAMA
jgi:8-oxo-dGTP diphosphatase